MIYSFIIPYRDRKEHLKIFIERYSGFKLNDDYKFYFIHQTDNRPFNRGALLNIGFLEASKERPESLFIFHDVDTLPKYFGSIQYDTVPGTVRRCVGSHYHYENLGTICCFYKSEFEKVNGFPNYWGWGVEDVTLIKRVQKSGINIDISNCAIFHSDRCEQLNHSRHPQQEQFMHQNDRLCKEELSANNFSNGLNNLKYKILNNQEIHKNFYMLDAEFEVL